MRPQPFAVRSPTSLDEGAPVVANANRILREGTPIPTFRENAWNLAAMAPPRQRQALVCKFDLIPRQFRHPTKKAVWLLINEGKPPHAVRRGGTNTKKWVAVGAITQFVYQIGAFLTYVTKETPEVR